MMICSPQYGLAPYSSAGGEVYDEKILKKIADKGIVVEVILPHQKPCDTRQKNWNIHYIPLPYIHYSYLFNFAMLPQLFSIYRKAGFMTLRVHSPYYVGIGAWIFKKFFAPDIKLLAIYHHLEKKFLFNKIDRFLIKRFDAIVTVSQFTKDELVEEFHIVPDNIQVIYNGVSEVYKPAPKNKEVLDTYNLRGKSIAVFCGSLIKRKNVSFLINLLEALKEPSLHLLVIGDGPERQNLEKEAKQLGVEKKITFLGHQEETAKVKILQTADLFLFPSLKEGFGLAVAEAMACGLPVITSNRGALPEVVGNKEATLPLNTDMWARKVRQFIDNPDYVKEQSQASLARSREFSWDKAADKFISLL